MTGKPSALRHKSRALFISIFTLCLLAITACQDSSDSYFHPAIAEAIEACAAALRYTEADCKRQCSRLTTSADKAACSATCETARVQTEPLCHSPLDQFTQACSNKLCKLQIDDCRAEAAADYMQCNNACGEGALRCLADCDIGRATTEEHCGFAPAEVIRGGATVPLFQPGKPAHLRGLLDDDEMAVVTAADERAKNLRYRSIELWTGAPSTPIKVTQVEHDFSFGVPLDIREFENEPENLSFYGDVARKHTSLLVAETSLKWRNVEREEGVFRFDLADAELNWAEQMGFDIKAHVLMWGNDPPLASGSGTPEWLRDRFPKEDLSAAEVQELRTLIREHVERVVTRYAGRIDVWEVTNEMLNPITDWFAVRLGQEIVNDIFRWARKADPGAQLVYNEWINEIFTGLGGPDTVEVRDRILELLEAGVPVDALGQQGHFAPGLVNVGVDVDLSQRTRVDDYADALNTLAETGLPIHITEVTFAAPEEPEDRAAQAEAILRIWWGHPSVEEIIFWNFWNPLGPRSHLNLGLFSDERNLSRHGEAILSLINDRWRTRVEDITDDRGRLELRATHGTYIAEWETRDGPVHTRFHVAPGPEGLRVVAVRR